MRENSKLNNPYATNKGGRIDAINKQKNEPKATIVKKQNDLRTK